MDLIITDSNFNELGYLKKYELDLEIGKYGVSSNDFQLTINTDDMVDGFSYDSLFYIENTEYGGYVENIKVDTQNKTISYLGKTFRGMLEKEYIQPPSGQAYLNLKGEANKCINELTNRKFNDLFVVDDVGLSEININYSIRDLNLLQALENALGTQNAKIGIIHHSDGLVHLHALKNNDLSDSIQYDNNYKVGMVVQTKKKPYNHILALGKGELTDRLRVNLYLQKNGTWSDTEYYKGLDRKSYKYDDTNTEVLEELKSNAIKKVIEENGTDTLEISFESDNADLFDIVSTKEQITGAYFKSQITQKILKITNNSIAISYKVGD